jgi:hypothetical protein
LAAKHGSQIQRKHTWIGRDNSTWRGQSRLWNFTRFQDRWGKLRWWRWRYTSEATLIGDWPMW